MIRILSVFSSFVLFKATSSSLRLSRLPWRFFIPIGFKAFFGLT